MAEGRGVGWAIVGCGRVAERRVAPVFSKIDDAYLAAVCSRSAARAGRFAESCGARRAYGDFGEMLTDPAVEVVYVAAPNALHAEIARQALSAGKHVLVEKPMATSAADARAMIETAGAAKRLLGVMHQQRFHPANVHLIRLADEGRLGKLNVLRIQVGNWYPAPPGWRRSPELAGGGVLMDHGPHSLDILLELGGDVRRVHGHIKSMHAGGTIEDFCCARLDFASGAVGLLELSTCCHGYGGRVEAYGSDATFVATGSMQQAGLYQMQLQRGEQRERPEEGTSADEFRAAVEDFTDAVRHEGEPSVDMHDGLRVIRLIEAIYASGREGRDVELPAGTE